MIECNFDGLVGPTHNYAGLPYGNVASQTYVGTESNPKLAAKQGLAKMRLLMQLGVPQAVIPPQLRPNLNLLKELGFTGKTPELLQKAYKTNPRLLAAVYSASSMWTANMATVSPSCNTADGKLHITPANLTYNLHRAQEAEFNYKMLQALFADSKYFTVHAPLPSYRDLSDEGAANHSVLSAEYGVPGLELFAYGREGLDDKMQTTLNFPARQTYLASNAIAQTHGIKPNATLLVRQNPIAINAGAFHNDVVFVANKNVILCHAESFTDTPSVLQKISDFFNGKCFIFNVAGQDVPLAEAVRTYMFNSQLVSLPNNKMALIMPMECKQSSNVVNIINFIIERNSPIQEIYYVECKQSMQNGGGPACLRLRVQLTPEQKAACKQEIFLTDKLYAQLEAWIDKHYRDKLAADDLLDPSLVNEVHSALDELTSILKLGSLYTFQQ